MLQTEVRAATNRDAAGAVEQGVYDALFDAADAGFAQALEDVPVGATSGLLHSAFEPERTQDGAVRWGFSAEYARAVRDGTRPHWPPIAPLKLWARRVLGDESAAWRVQWKIAQEGTEGQDYIGPAIEVMKAHLRSTGIGAFIEEAL